ncbi:hypothetical protein Mapa_016693 [Marchantia paleacea]|nr:hypothetical protein Mapa_016693 [Marchantia paleacea]
MGDWRAMLKAQTREANVKRILEILEKYVPSEGLEAALLRFSKNFEEDCWKNAKDLAEYNKKIKVEIETIENYDRLCEDNPFTSRQYEGFLGAIKMTYTSKTVAAPQSQRKRDPDEITLEQSAKTVLKRKSSLKAAVSTLLLKSALNRGKSGGLAISHAASALLQKIGTGEMGQTANGHPNTPEQTTSTQRSESPSSPTATQAHARHLFQKKNKNPLAKNINMHMASGQGGPHQAP